MKIIFATEATGWTGGANQIWLTSQELRRRGHEIVVACSPEGDLSRRLAAAGVPVEPVPIRQDYDLPAARAIARIADERGASLIHAHHPKAHAVCLLSRWLWTRVPLVVTRRVINPIRKNPFSRFKYNSGKIARYIAVCQAAADELAAVGVAPERISVIPSGIDTRRWDASRKDRASLGSTPPLRVIMVGHYSPIKGHSILLQAAARVIQEFPSVLFQLVGRETAKLRPEAERLGVAGHVEILGERTDVPELLSKTHLFVMPSLMEGIGTALIEAQAAGVPVVASEVGGLPDVVEKGVTGLLTPPGDAQALASALLRLLKSPEEREAMAARAVENARKNFSVEAVTDRLEDLYTRMARP